MHDYARCTALISSCEQWFCLQGDARARRLDYDGKAFVILKFIHFSELKKDLSVL